MLVSRAMVVVVLAGVLAFGACAHQAAVHYPATPAGRALQRFYEGTDQRAAIDLMEAVGKLDAEGRGEMSACVLAILRRDVVSERALWLAYEWSNNEPALPATAPEYQALVPTLAKRLATNGARGEGNSAGIALLLARMGPDVARPALPEVGRRFNLAWDQHIDGESDEGWTRFALSRLLVGFGSEGMPALVESLQHSNAFVRKEALEALGDTREDYKAKGPGWDKMLARWDDIQAAKKAVLPALRRMMQEDADPAIRQLARRVDEVISR